VTTLPGVVSDDRSAEHTPDVKQLDWVWVVILMQSVGVLLDGSSESACRDDYRFGRDRSRFCSISTKFRGFYLMGCRLLKRMALQLSHAVSDGIRRTLTRTGGILFVGFLVLQFGIQIAVNSTVLGYLPPEAAAQFSRNTGLTLPMSGSAGLALFGILIILSSVYFVILSRTFAQPLNDVSTFPAMATQRLGRATATALVGGLIVSITVMIGFLFLFLPGLFFAASFLFFIFAVAVEDRGIISSLKQSWGLARGSRLKLSVLVVVSGLFGGVIGGVAPLLDLAGVAVAADVVTVVLTAVFFLPYYAIIASAYLQLRDGHNNPDRSTSNPVNASQTQKL